MTTQDGHQRPCSGKEVLPDEYNITRRKKPPAHYILDIESLSFLAEILSNSQHGYESPEFEASGHKWRLILHPYGQHPKNGVVRVTHISFYLEIMDTHKLGGAWEIRALINFFMFIHKENQYFSIQDGKVKTYSAAKKVWGFDRIPRNELIDALEENCSKFGVEVFVIKDQDRKGERFPIKIHLNDNYFFSWKVEDFKLKLEKGGSIKSDKEFTIGDYKWKLQLYPSGVPKAKEKYLSIFLHLIFPEIRSASFEDKIYVDFKIRIINRNYDKIIEKSANAWFRREAHAWGFPYFMKLEHLKKEEIFSIYDAVEFEAEICSISVSKDLFPPKVSEPTKDKDSKADISAKPF